MLIRTLISRLPGRAEPRRTRWRPVSAVVTLVVALAIPVGVTQVSEAGTDESTAPGDFVVLQDVAPTILHEIRYHGHHNFIGRPIVGYQEPLCIVTKPAADALVRAQQKLRKHGYTLKMYDCYRPQRAVDDFARWAERSGDERMKEEFYPRVDKSVLFDEGYIASRSGHSRGSTVDLTLVKLPPASQREYVPGEPLVPCFAPYDERFPDNTVDMGTGYDCFDTLAHTHDPRITGEARSNRLLLKETLDNVGFNNYANEWWHYTLRYEPYPDTYFDFPVARDSLS